MRIRDILSEAPLADYQPIGDFSKPGPFRAVDRKLVPHPVNRLNAIKFFERTPYDFRLFFSNVPGTGRYHETGATSPDQIRKIFGDTLAEQIIQGHEGAITVVYVGNQGDRAVPMTPWIMAHRFGHAVRAGQQSNRFSEWRSAEEHFFKTVNQTLEQVYQKSASDYYRHSEVKWGMTPEYNALFNVIGTQRSSRNQEIRRPYEFMYEMLAQYIGQGGIRLNPLPDNLGYGRQAWGRPTRYLNAKPEYRSETERARTSDMLANDMGMLFNDVLGSVVGQILVM